MAGRGGIKELVDGQILDARSLLGPRLQAAFDRLASGRGLLGPDAAPYFDPLGHPLFELPSWLAARLRADGGDLSEADEAAALGVSALGYLYARAHDDWLDGDGPGGAAPIALADALLARCTRLLAAVTGDSARFWARYEQIMAAYAEALVHTTEVRRAGAGVTRSTFEGLLAQSRPLAIPSLALLDRCDRWELAPALEELTFSAAAASQLYDDLTDLHRDHEAGQPTWAVASVVEGPQRPLWLDLLADGGGNGVFGERVADALAYHERTVQAARTLGLADAEGWLAERRAVLEDLPGALREGLLAAFTGRLAGGAVAPAGAERG